jgi:hypothetical protein
MELIAEDRALRLRAAIDALPTPFREALVLRELQNLNYRTDRRGNGCVDRYSHVATRPSARTPYRHHANDRRRRK